MLWGVLWLPLLSLFLSRIKNSATPMPMTGSMQCQWLEKNSIAESSFCFLLLTAAATAAASAGRHEIFNVLPDRIQVCFIQIVHYFDITVEHTH